RRSRQAATTSSAATNRSGETAIMLTTIRSSTWIMSASSCGIGPRRVADVKPRSDFEAAVWVKRGGRTARLEGNSASAGRSGGRRSADRAQRMEVGPAAATGLEPLGLGLVAGRKQDAPTREGIDRGTRRQAVLAIPRGQDVHGITLDLEVVAPADGRNTL